MSSSSPSGSVSKRLAALLGLLAGGALHGAEVVAEVRATRGVPVAEAVVWVTPLAGKVPHKLTPAIVAHQNRQFCALRDGGAGRHDDQSAKPRSRKTSRLLVLARPKI